MREILLGFFIGMAFTGLMMRIILLFIPDDACLRAKPLPPPCTPTQSKILRQQADIKFLQDEIKQEIK